MSINKKTIEIYSKTGWFDLRLGEVWEYKDLIFMFVKRSFVTMYKQTILGPLWFIINPLMTTLVFTIVFGNIAHLSTDGAPAFLFYMAGNTLWSYFATCVTSTSSTFTSNAHIMGKVYFPRLTMPISSVIFALISFAIQYIMLIAFTVYYQVIGQVPMVGWNVLLTPLLILEVMVLGLGVGIIISSLTTKYRDLNVLVGFGISLWMYATPVVYASSTLSDKWRKIIMLNPMSPIVETFRCLYLNAGKGIPTTYLIISTIMTVVIIFIGILLFSKVEKTFMDTV